MPKYEQVNMEFRVMEVEEDHGRRWKTVKEPEVEEDHGRGWLTVKEPDDDKTFIVQFRARRNNRSTGQKRRWNHKSNTVR